LIGDRFLIRPFGAGIAKSSSSEGHMAHVNDQSIVDLPNSPFGGEKNSGIGRFNGHWAIEAFTTDQWVTVQHAARRYPWNANEVQGPWAGKRARQDTGAHESELCRLLPNLMKRAARRLSASILQLSEAGSRCA
jgi:hypothetical protein